MVEWQQSFGAGEIHPGLHRQTLRSDLRLGLHTLRNFLITAEGTLINRPGTQHINTLPGAPLSVMFPFDCDATPVAATHGALGRVLFTTASPGGGGGGASTRLYSAGSRTDRRYRLDADYWIAAPQNLGRVVTLGNRSLLLRSDGGVMTEVRWDVSGSVLTVPKMGAATNVITDVPTVPPAYSGLTAMVWLKDGDPSLAGASGQTDREWRYQVTFILRDPDGQVFETMPMNVDAFTTQEDPGVGGLLVGFPMPEAFSVSASAPRRIWVGFEAGDDIGGDTFVAARIYRGRSGRFGYLGETTGEVFEDDGATPEFNNPPPQGRNPFSASFGAPRVVTHHQGRRVFGATISKPMRLWGSKVENFANFDEALPAESGLLDDDDPFEVELASDTNEVIRNLVSRNRRIWALTSRGEWVVGGTDESGIITPNAGSADKISGHGCADLPAVVAEDAILFVDRDYDSVLRLAPNGEIVDLTAGARHLFRGFSITSLAYAHKPTPTVWVTRNDGMLLAGAFAEGAAGWAPQELSGTALAVGCIPEGGEDGVYLLVQYGDTYTVERLAKRLWTDIRDAIHLDRCVTHNGLTLNAPVTIVSASQLTFGVGGFVGKEGTYIKIDVDDGKGALLFELQEETAPSTYDARLVNRPLPADYVGATVAQWWRCVESVSGLAHLNGQTVMAVADGVVHKGLTVAAGSVVLPQPAGKVHVGLAYTSRLQTLPSVQDRGGQRTLRQTWVSVVASRGGKVAETLNSEQWEALPVRAVSDGYGLPALRTEEVPVKHSSQWGREGFAAFVQDEPMPVEIVAIGREYAGSGR